MFFYYLMIFLFAFNTHPILSAEIGGFTTVKIAGGIALIYGIWNHCGSNRKSKISKSMLAFFTFFVFAFLISSLLNCVPLNVRYGPRFVSALLLVACTIFLVKDTKQISKIIYILIISMDFSTLWIIKQYLGGMRRPGGTFGDSNYYAIAAVFIIGLTLVLGKNGQQRSLFFYGSTILNSVGLILSGSRGGILGIGVAVFYLWWTSKNKIRNAIVFIITITTLVTVVPNNLEERFNNTNTGARVSTEHRVRILEIGWELFKTKPVFGIGPGNYKIESGDFFEDKQLSRMAHNSYLEVLTELGLTGIFPFLGMCFCCIRQFQKKIRSLKQRDERKSELEIYCRAILIGFMGYLIGVVFLSAEYEKILWLCFALALIIAAIPSAASEDSALDEA
nr:O-antigen ligase family protein [uncultured Desulfobacter sp.]